MWENLKHPMENISGESHISTQMNTIHLSFYRATVSKKKSAVKKGQSVTWYNRSGFVHVKSQLGKHTHGSSEGLCPSREPYLTVQ
jgi:hypothetical protein